LGDIKEEEKMAQLYSASDVFALPSVEDNLPNMMLESLSCGTPVLGFRVGGISEMVVDGSTGLLCEAGDVVSFARGLRTLLDCSRDKSAQMRRNCRAFAVDAFSYSTTTGKYASLYRRLSEDKRGGQEYYSDSALVEMEYEDLIAKYYRRVISERDSTIQEMSSSTEYKIGRVLALPKRIFKRLFRIGRKLIKGQVNG
jgi:hypothetical protein